MRLVPAWLLVLVLVLVGCASMPAPDDPFFTLPLAGVSPHVHGPAPGPGNGYAIRLRFLRQGEILDAPTLVVNRGERANVRLVNQTSYISDFDVETADRAFLADPVVSIVRDGIMMEFLARPAPNDRRISLSFGLLVSELTKPIRTRTLTIDAGPAVPVTIQLPAIEVTRMAGRTLLDPGVDSFLVEIPSGDGEPLVVFARIEPVELPDGFDSGASPADEINLVPGPGAEPLDLLDEDAGRRPPPRSGGTLSVSVARTGTSVPTLHLDRLSESAAFDALGLVPLRTLRMRSAPERGARLSSLLRKSYVRDYERRADEGIPEVWDPAIDTVEVGLTTSVEEENGEPVLRWSLSSLREISDHTSAGTQVPLLVELPEVRLRQGSLPLRGAVNLTEIAELPGGDRLALLVVRTDE